MRIVEAEARVRLEEMMEHLSRSIISFIKTEISTADIQLQGNFIVSLTPLFECHVVSKLKKDALKMYDLFSAKLWSCKRHRLTFYSINDLW